MPAEPTGAFGSVPGYYLLKMLRTMAASLTLLSLAAVVTAQVGTDLSTEAGSYGKPGQCPRQDFGTCALQCYRDEECRGDYKCCPTACGGTSCVRPVAASPPLTCANVRCAPGTVCVLRDPAPGCQTRCEPVPTCVTRDVCYEPVKSGPCYAYFPRYFYNAESGRCEQFIYGGCQANGNNFLSQRDCQNVCERDHSGGGGCYYQGRYYRNGAVITTPDPCVYCTCSNGRVACDRIRCPRPPCQYPVTTPGHCCPTCPY